MEHTRNAESTERLSTSFLYKVMHPLQGQSTLYKLVRFCIVGVYNTGIDILMLNLLLWFFPTHNATSLLGYNSLAFFSGALNSYVLNKYWTFRQSSSVTRYEIIRFAVLTALSVLCNNTVLWFVASITRPFIVNTLLWANTAKVCAIIATATISYTGMHFWVFAKSKYQEGNLLNALLIKRSDN